MENVGMAPDLLELFPSEVMTNVLCSLPTINALYSLIRASRFANECFKAIKQRVLRRVLMNELGPVVRDAIFCEYQDTIDFTGEDEIEILITATAEYSQILHEATAAEIQQHLTPEVVVKIIQRKRLLQRITRFLSGPILDEIRILDPNAAQPLTDAEQRRFLQALFRYSVLLRYDPHDTDNDPDEILWHDHPCLHMFAAWEMQQVAEIGSYMSTLWYTLLYGGRCGPRGGQQGGSGGVEDRYVREYNLTMKYAHDLRTLWRKLESSVAEVSVLQSVLVGMLRMRDMNAGLVRIANSSNTDWFDGPQGRAVPTTRTTVAVGQGMPEPGGSSSSSRSSSTASSPSALMVSSPPFAWSDGLAGNIWWPRWGPSVIEEAPSAKRPSALTVAMNTALVQEWRWYGFAFWDEERVTRLKRTRRDQRKEDNSIMSGGFAFKIEEWPSMAGSKFAWMSRTSLR